MRGGGGAGDGSGGTRNEMAQRNMFQVQHAMNYKMHHRPPITMQFAHCAHIILYICNWKTI